MRLNSLKKFLKTALIYLIVAAMLPVSAFNQISAQSAYNGRDDFLWGINIHNIGYSDYSQDPETYIKPSAELGSDIVRINIGYTGDNFEYLDRVVEHCDRYNLKIMMVVSLNSDYNANIAYFEKLATRYDGKHGKGFVDYYQLGNEESIGLLRNKYPTGAPDGSSINHYYASDLAALKLKYESAIKGIENSGTASKTVINFSYLHYGVLLYMYQNGLQWDMVGIDWYTNMPDISEVLTRTEAVLPHDIIICESNLWNHSGTNHEDASEWDTLVSYMGTCYNDSRVKGLIFYELMDEPVYESGEYNSESHFGFIYTGPGGTIAGYKPIYYRIQSLLGGGSVTPKPKITEEVHEVLDLYGSSHNGRTLAEQHDWKYSFIGDIQTGASLAAADFADCDTVEFDMHIGNFEALSSDVADYGLTLWFRLSSNENRYLNNSAAIFTLDELEDLGGGYYRARIAKERFTRNEGGAVDWANIRSWQFFFEGGSSNIVDDLYSMQFSFRNICSSAVPPSLPGSSIAVIDEAGRQNTIGGCLHFIIDRLWKNTGSSANLSKADYIELDLQVSDFAALKARLAETGLALQLRLTSSADRYNGASTVVLDDKYLTERVGKWYHYIIPKSDMTQGAINWSAVQTWALQIGGNNVPSNAATDVNLRVMNLCGSIRELKSDYYTVLGDYVDLPAGISAPSLPFKFYGSVTITDKNGNSVPFKPAATGMILTLKADGTVLDTATIAVKNDISCDGYANSNDLVTLRKVLLGLEEMSKAQRFALTQNDFANITIKNLVALKKALA